MSVGEIVEAIEKYGINHVVLTSGEPMLFDPIENLAIELKNRNHTITIETAGTINRQLPCDLMSISPKLAHSTPGKESGWQQRHEAARLAVPVLQSLVDSYPYQLKFVVNPETGNDLTEIETLLGQLHNIESSRVLLMPEGTDSETLHRRSRMLVDEVIKRNWRLTQRLHIDLFGNTKGT